jgi:phosphoadenosine phosphosulfate reductase
MINIPTISKEYAEALNEEFSSMSEIEVLSALSQRHIDKIVFSTSFGKEDQAITHMIAKSVLPIKLFTLDTGRLFKETYSVWDATIQKYKVKIHTYFPDAKRVEDFISTNGPNSFYDGVENRKLCCTIRKVEPLKRALIGNEIWVTGIRAEQSDNRLQTEKFEFDAVNNIIKYHPILNWTFDQLEDYVDQNNVPINKLHKENFVSIGCQPCTRAIKEGESFRDGRWWWENKSTKECGLHMNNENIKTK